MATADKSAPHGREADGTPKAPYGINIDGTPRKSRRGARAGQRAQGNTRATTTTKSLTDTERASMLCELADMALCNPLATLSQAPFLARRIGPQQTDALAGDALIIAHFAPPIADAVVMYAAKKPGCLAWLDKVEENAPMALLVSAVLSMGKALLDNHLRPNPAMAEAGRSMAATKMAKVAAEVNRQAAAFRAANAPAEPTPDGPPADDEPVTEQFARAA